MRIGINGTGLVQRASADAIAAHAAQAAADGFASYWLAELPTGGFDALTVLALVGQRVAGIELGTAVVPTFPRHPMALAGQALTVHAAIGGRLTLGVGLSHAPLMAQLGIGFERPMRHLREFLSILAPLLSDGKVSFRGELLACDAQVFRAPSPRCPLVVAALGPQALAIAGALTDGTTLAWVGPRTIREHIVPRLSEAAAHAGRPAPRVIATLPVCVTDDVDAVREQVGRMLSMYGELPSYRAMFEREGVAGPADVALIGSEEAVREQVGRLADAGVTDFAPTEFTPGARERERTRAFLRSYLPAG
jgi:F420-dependent oxidoreductase-like protein